MAAHDFQVRPLKQYDGARYHSAYRRPGPAPAAATPVPVEEGRQRSWMELLRVATMFALVFTLTLAMVACYPQNDDDQHQQQWASDGGSDGGDDADGGDITMGVMVECTPGDIQCLDDMTLQTCTDAYWYETVDCNTWCQDTYGADYGSAWSAGCDASAAEPCQCQYDMVDGGMPYCSPGETLCLDDQTLQTCDANYTPVITDCNSYCQAQSPDGLGWSAGCDASAEDPCMCQYDLVAGEMVQCLPGDIYCSDADTVQVCNDDQVSYTAYDCATYCTETYGPDHGTTGCDATTPDNFCGCLRFVAP